MKHIRGRFGVACATMAVIAVVIFAVTGVIGSAASAVMEKVGARPSAPDTVDPQIFDATPPAMDVAPAPAHVVGPATAEPGTDADAVTRRIEGVGPAPGRVFGQVIDAESGKVLHESEPTSGGIPASTMKVLTSLAVLDAYGPQHQFTTEVRGDAADSGVLWLVGGGDPTLSRADLEALADQTAESLRAEGAPRVSLGVDATIFAGDPWNPAWPDVYRDYVTPSEGLWVDRGRLSPNPVGPREAQPADAAGRVFADALKARGIEVTGISRGDAPEGDATVDRARVESPPLSTIVESALAFSDNDTTEILFRHVGRVDGGDGSLDSARQKQRKVLEDRGLWVDGMVVDDGSGLSRENRVAASTLAGAIGLASAEEEPDLRAVLTGLPVAGAEGTLLDRYVEDGTAPGRGVVRGKTGTLTGVSSLAGYMRDKDGAILVFAFIVNGAPEADYGARVYLDRVTSALADCGCS